MKLQFISSSSSSSVFQGYINYGNDLFDIQQEQPP